ncbi:hypothetical protein B0A55_12357 [Friedmanniomyces simplex]|uniref:Uncharacterized protein n=1 Tax=Friedmanniomyces simplex TaxID=329884 RepID=A0A4U0W943_9PEZI|nr:hypothetical protein B0A55_12357 [Friedmanniomyces simplex]
MPTLPFRSKKQASSGGFSGGKAREVRKNAELAEEFERRTPRQNEIGQTYPTKDNERHRPGRADWSDSWEDSPDSSGSDVIIKLREKDARWAPHILELGSHDPLPTSPDLVLGSRDPI